MAARVIVGRRRARGIGGAPRAVVGGMAARVMIGFRRARSHSIHCGAGMAARARTGHRRARAKTSPRAHPLVIRRARDLWSSSRANPTQSPRARVLVIVAREPCSVPTPGPESTRLRRLWRLPRFHPDPESAREFVGFLVSSRCPEASRPSPGLPSRLRRTQRHDCQFTSLLGFTQAGRICKCLKALR